jgi:hypothetical protein
MKIAPLQLRCQRWSRKPSRRAPPEPLPALFSSNWETVAYLRYEEEMRRH